MFTGSHSPRRVVRRSEQGILNDGREHSLRIERLPGRLVCVWRFVKSYVFYGIFFCCCFLSLMLLFLVFNQVLCSPGR